MVIGNRRWIVVIALLSTFVPMVYLHAVPVPRLYDQLRTELRAGRDVELEFLKKVVELVEQDQLPLWMVESTMIWARPKLPHPFLYFQQAIRIRAARIGVIL